MAKKVIIFAAVFFGLFADFSFGQSLEKRLKGNSEMVYKVYYNAIPVGKIKWQYLGRKAVEGKLTDVLSLEADTQIMKLLNLTNKEKVFLDAVTRLPHKVERDVVFFGKEELIEEFYDQDRGCVKVRKTSGKVKEEEFCPGKPVHNILELLYFFPENIALKENGWMKFNLPTQKLKIKYVKEKTLKIGKKERQVYFLKGNGDKKFNLWLDKEKKMPLRLEFITWVGKVTILRRENSQ